LKQSKRKKFLALLDIAISEIISQKLQTVLVKDYLSQNNSDLVFYLTESYLTFETCDLLMSKLSENLNIDGFAFYSLLQLSYKGNLNTKLIKKILNKNLSIYFVREDLKFENEKDLKKKLIDLKIFISTHRSLIKSIKENFNKIKKKPSYEI
tara:strand:- start:1087 stop:1542 length:456 start_codon:yes stop_codon:yes gene_type:complete